MPIPLEHTSERLSVAYVHAITAKAGALFMVPNGIEYGTDGIIQSVKVLTNGTFVNTGWLFNCQLKSTTNWIERPTHIAYDLDVAAYNKLVRWEGSPIILILLRLPANKNEWLSLDEDSLILKNCCYWAHVQGPPSDNSQSIRIEIPRNQLFTPDAVVSILSQIEANNGGFHGSGNFSY